MSEYQVQVKTFGDIIRLRKLCKQHHVDGYVRQNEFQASLAYGVLPLLLVLPLDEAVLCIKNGNDQDVSRIETLLPELQG